MTIQADPTKTIGRSIATTGVYDIAVSELLTRLIRPGDLVIDVGANVGYMTLLMGIRAGNSGTVISLEPHPQLFPVLKQNVAAAQARFPFARPLLLQIAVTDHEGTAMLAVPAAFSTNDGLAHLSADHDTGTTTIEVIVQRLDDLLEERQATVAKIDAEGHELTILHGADASLRAHRIKHVLFEDHTGEQSAVCPLLESYGYTVFQVGWAMFGPMIRPWRAPKICRSYEAPSFLATVEPDWVLAQCDLRGWSVLDPGLPERST